MGLIPVEIYSCVKSWKEDPDSLDLQRDTLRKAVRGIGSPCPFYLFLSFIYLFSVCAGSFSSCSERGLLSSPGPRASRHCSCFSMPSTGSRHAGSSSCLQSECRDSNPNNQTHTHTHTRSFIYGKEASYSNWETTIIPLRMSKILHTPIGNIGFLREPVCVVCS